MDKQRAFHYDALLRTQIVEQRNALYVRWARFTRMNIILRDQTKPQSVASKPTLTRGVAENRGHVLHLPRTTTQVNIYSLPAKCFF